ncbi:MAG: DUF3179 domain-containing (seleno)protein [Bacillota bacterium]
MLSENIVSGGPAPDGIPPIEEPNYIGIEEADQELDPEDAVFLFQSEDEVYVYPQKIMVWHEIVNEEFDGEKVSITYCPLTGSAIAYLGEVLKSETTFGTSGKLVNSNLIMYDRETDSYWPQIYGRAITGDITGEKLERVPLFWTQWQLIKENFSEVNVLSQETGFNRNYDQDPYGSYIEDESSGNYYTNNRLVFDVITEDDRLERKDIVIAGEYNEIPFAINKDEIKEAREISFLINNEKLTAKYIEKLNTVEVYQENGEEIVVFDVMWFGWSAFFPETELIDNDNPVKNDNDEISKPREIVVDMLNFYFEPSEIQVEPGEEVSFIVNNPSNAFHTFTIYHSRTDRAEPIVNISLSGGEKEQVTVTMPVEEKTLYLVCLPHEGIDMVGSIIIGNP